MSDPNATPAPLTMTPEEYAEVERRIDAAIFDGADVVSSTAAYRLWDELAATRAELVGVTHERDVARQACANLTTMRDSASAKLAEAESRVAALTEALGTISAAMCDCDDCLQCWSCFAAAALSPSQDAKGGTVTAR